MLNAAGGAAVSVLADSHRPGPRSFRCDGPLAMGAQVTEEGRTAAESDELCDFTQCPGRLLHQAQRRRGSLAFEVGGRRDPLDCLESPQEVKGRQMGGPRDVLQADRPGVVRVDKRYPEANSPKQFATSGRLRGRKKPLRDRAT